MACLSTLMKTWLPSVPLASTNLSTYTCTIAKVCSKSFALIFPCETWIVHQPCSTTASQLEIRSIKAASATNLRTIRNASGNPTLLDTSAASALDQFAQTTRLALKTKSIKEQLDSVLVIIHPLAVLLTGCICMWVTLCICSFVTHFRKHIEDLQFPDTLVNKVDIVCMLKKDVLWMNLSPAVACVCFADTAGRTLTSESGTVSFWHTFVHVWHHRCCYLCPCPFKSGLSSIYSVMLFIYFRTGE